MGIQVLVDLRIRTYVHTYIHIYIYVWATFKFGSKSSKFEECIIVIQVIYIGFVRSMTTSLWYTDDIFLNIAFSSWLDHTPYKPIHPYIYMYISLSLSLSPTANWPRLHLAAGCPRQATAGTGRGEVVFIFFKKIYFFGFNRDMMVQSDLNWSRF